MKITFFYAAFENLGIEYLSAALKAKGHTTELVFSPSVYSTDNTLKRYLHLSDAQLAKKIIATSPDLVAFSIMSDMFGRLKNIASLVKNYAPHIKIIAGGIHPTSRPQMLEENNVFDYLCLGEGEDAMIELAEALENNRPTNHIQNIWSKENNTIYKNELRPLNLNIDTIPFPDKDLFLSKYPLNTQSLYMTMTGRGCPFNCTYCYNSFIRDIYPKNYLRRRSVDNVITEMSQAAKRPAIAHALFVDDTFIYDKQWLTDFCQQYKEKIKMPFMCQIHARYTDLETISLLEDAGCGRVLMGIQTLSQDIRDNIIKRNETTGEIQEAINLVAKSKLSLYVTVMHELPTQTDEDIKAMARFFSKNPVDRVLSFKLRYYPKIKINHIAESINHLPAEEIAKMEQSDSYLATMGPSSHDKNLLFLASISSLLPQNIVELLLKYKLYKLKIPFIHLFLAIYCLLRDLLTNMLRKKQIISFVPMLKVLTLRIKNLFIYIISK